MRLQVNGYIKYKVVCEGFCSRVVRETLGQGKLASCKIRQVRKEAASVCMSLYLGPLFFEK